MFNEPIENNAIKEYKNPLTTYAKLSKDNNSIKLSLFYNSNLFFETILKEEEFEKDIKYSLLARNDDLYTIPEQSTLKFSKDDILTLTIEELSEFFKPIYPIINALLS